MTRWHSGGRPSCLITREADALGGVIERRQGRTEAARQQGRSKGENIAGGSIVVPGEEAG